MNQRVEKEDTDRSNSLYGLSLIFICFVLLCFGVNVIHQNSFNDTANSCIGEQIQINERQIKTITALQNHIDILEDRIRVLEKDKRLKLLPPVRFQEDKQ